MKNELWGLLAPDALFSKVKNRSCKSLLDYNGCKGIKEGTQEAHCLHQMQLADKQMWKLPFDALGQFSCTRVESGEKSNF